MTELKDIAPFFSIAIAIISVYIATKKNSKDDLDKRITWERDQERRLASLERDLARMTPVNDRIVALETQVAPLWKIVEDSVLKSVIHNPLTVEERRALTVYWNHKDDPSWCDKEVLETGKKGLQRELKQLEDDPKAATESTIPYVLTIAAIDRRLAGAGPS